MQFTAVDIYIGRKNAVKKRGVERSALDHRFPSEDPAVMRA